MIGPQRPVQVDHGARGGCDAHLTAPWPTAGARVPRSAAPAHGRVARACEYAHHTARPARAVHRVSARSAIA